MSKRSRVLSRSYAAPSCSLAVGAKDVRGYLESLGDNVSSSVSAVLRKVDAHGSARSDQRSSGADALVNVPDLLAIGRVAFATRGVYLPVVKRPGLRDEAPDDFDDVDLLATAPGALRLLRSIPESDIYLVYVPSLVKMVVLTNSGFAFDVEIAERDSSWAILASASQANEAQPVEFHLPHDNSVVARVPPITVLFAIKRSHIFFPIKWHQHIEDLHQLLASYPDDVCWDATKLSDPIAAFVASVRFAELCEQWGVPGGHINLNKTNDEFFGGNDMVRERRYDHDALHELVAYGDRPLYERLKRDPTRALVDRDLFEAAPESDKLCLVREECMAIALERFLLPCKGVGEHDEDAAYALAVERVCTTLSKGWFRDYAASHYPLIRDLDVDLVEVAAKVRSSPNQYAYVPPKQTAPPTADNKLPSLDGLPDNDIVPLTGITSIPEGWLDPQHVATVRFIMTTSQLQSNSTTHHEVSVRWPVENGEGHVEAPFSVAVRHEKAGWTGRSTRGSFELEAKLRGETVLTISVVREVQDHYEYDDSGCEWSNPYAYQRHYSTLETVVKVHANRVNGPSCLPPGLFLATCFHLTDVNDSLENSHLSQALGLSPIPLGFSSPSNFATVWERQYPLEALRHSVRFQPSIDLTVLPNLWSLSDCEVNELARELERATHATSAILNCDDSETIMRLAEALPATVVNVRVVGNRYRFRKMRSFGNFSLQDARPTGSPSLSRKEAMLNLLRRVSGRKVVVV